MKRTPNFFSSSLALVQSRLNRNSMGQAVPQAHYTISARWPPDTSTCSCCFGGKTPNTYPQTLCLRLFSIFLQDFRSSPSQTWRNLMLDVSLTLAFGLRPRFWQLPSQQLWSSTGLTQNRELLKLGTLNVSKTKFDPIPSDQISSNPIQICENFTCSYSCNLLLTNSK